MKQKLTAFSLFWQLFSGKLQPNEFWHKKNYRLKFLSRMIIAPRTVLWLKKLVKFHYFPIYFNGQPNITCKLQRSYLIEGLSQKAKYDALLTHYGLMESQKKELVQLFYAKTSTQIMQLIGKNDSPLFLHLFSNDGYKREGENSFAINSPTNGLATLTFCFIRYNGQFSLFIGGLQGSKVEDNPEAARNAISKATKDLFGLFPKRVLLQAVYAVATFFKAEQIVAVSNKTHFYNNWRYNRIIHASYDDFWEMNGGVRDKQNNYILPIYPEQKSLEDIPSKKRSEYRKRYELLENLDNSLNELLNKLSS